TAAIAVTLAGGDEAEVSALEPAAALAELEEEELDEEDSSASEEELAAQAEAEEGPLPDANDPTLDEPADAPLEEDALVEGEAEPPPPVVRPAARNPWAGREPATLALVKRRISRGQTITKRHMRQVASYRRSHPRDVRATLVLA